MRHHITHKTSVDALQSACGIVFTVQASPRTSSPVGYMWLRNPIAVASICLNLQEIPLGHETALLTTWEWLSVPDVPFPGSRLSAGLS